MDSDAKSSGKKMAGNVARSASVVGVAVFASRILGLIREQVFAAFFGAGMVFDAYVTAFRVPNLLRDLLAEGALSAAFVKTFSQKLEGEGKERAWKLANLVFTTLFVVASGGVLLCIFFAPEIIYALAPGFDAEKQGLAVNLARLMFPFLLMVALAAVSMGVLNSHNRFGIPALASSFFNLGSIVVGLVSAYLMAPEYMEAMGRAAISDEEFPLSVDQASNAIFGMAVGVLAGGALQFLIQIPSLRKTGFRFRPSLDLKDPGLRQILLLMIPAIIGTAATQVNVFVNNNFASHLEDGAVSYLNYAFRLMQFPIGIFGVAIATATLPAIARAVQRKDTTYFRDTLSSSLRLAVFLTLPSAVGLIALGEPIVALIYERGSFDATATLETAGALSFYAVGLVGYSLVKILAPAFYAIDDPQTPARISLLSVLTNVVLCYFLVGPLGHRGLALSTALVATANAFILLYLLRKKIDGLQILMGTRIAIASAVLYFVCRFSLSFLEEMFSGPGLLDRSVVVFGSMAAGGAVFLLVAHLLKVHEVRTFFGLFRRR